MVTGLARDTGRRRRTAALLLMVTLLLVVFGLWVMLGVARGQKGGAAGTPAGKGAISAGAKGGPVAGAPAKGAARAGTAAGARAPAAAGAKAGAGAAVAPKPATGAVAQAPKPISPQVTPVTGPEPFENWRVNPFMEYPLTPEQIAALLQGPPILQGAYNFPGLAVARYRAPAGWYRVPSALGQPGVVAPTVAPPGAGLQPSYASAGELLGPEGVGGVPTYGRLTGVRTSAVMLGQQTHAVIEWPSGNALVVRPGQQVSGGYVVDRILADQVLLRDTEGQLHSVPLAGMEKPPAAPPTAPTYYPYGGGQVPPTYGVPAGGYYPYGTAPGPVAPGGYGVPPTQGYYPYGTAPGAMSPGYGAPAAPAYPGYTQPGAYQGGAAAGRREKKE